MRRYRSSNGEERIWFEDAEIEDAMEVELRKANLMPTRSAPAVQVESFVERHLQVTLDQYADLEPSVLGITEFFEGKPPRISINKDLTGSALDDGDSPPGLLGRWRATVAHEAGHVLLHQSLFAFAVDSLSLFDQTPSPSGGRQLQRCLKRDLGHAEGVDWREVQANQAMAALLMPRSFFRQLAQEHIEHAFPGRGKIPFGGEDRVVAVISPLLQVSRQAARIRLSTVGLIAPRDQIEL